MDSAKCRLPRNPYKDTPATGLYSYKIQSCLLHGRRRDFFLQPPDLSCATGANFLLSTLLYSLEAVFEEEGSLPPNLPSRSMEAQKVATRRQSAYFAFLWSGASSTRSSALGYQLDTRTKMLTHNLVRYGRISHQSKCKILTSSSQGSRVPSRPPPRQ